MAAQRFSSRIIFLLAIAWLGVQCSSPVPAEPTPVETVTPTTVFTGSLDPGSSRFHPFTTVAAGTAAATFASLTDTSGLVLSIPLTIELGTVSEDTLGCVALATVQTRPSLVSATSLTVGAGTYCVRIADTGGLPGSATYTLRVVHP